MTKMGKWKRRFLVFFGLLIALFAALYIWATAPIKTDSNKADQAVLLANEIGKGEIKYREGYAGEPGSRIHYVTAGEGEAVIFIHGFPSYWFTMYGLMEEFKSDYQVVAVDGLGTGKSDAPRKVEDYELEKLVKHFGGVIDELGLESVHIVGHDWGTVIGTAYAQAYPEKVKSLSIMSALPYNVLLSRLEYDEKHKDLFSYTSYFSRANPVLIKILGIQDSIWEDIYKPFLDKGIISKKQAERFKADIGQPRRLNRLIHWYRANLRDYDSISDEDYWISKEARITVPALFMYGSEDIVVTPELVSDLKAVSDNLKVIKFEGVEHRPHYDEKAAVVKNIHELIEEN